MTDAEKKERMMQAELVIIRDMKLLMQRKPEEGLRWNSTKQDLFNMIHILYESEEVRDRYGVVMPFTVLVRHFCEILHERVPSNPYAYVTQSTLCQGCRRAPLLLRYDSMVGFLNK